MWTAVAIWLIGWGITDGLLGETSGWRDGYDRGVNWPEHLGEELKRRLDK